MLVGWKNTDDDLAGLHGIFSDSLNRQALEFSNKRESRNGINSSNASRLSFRSDYQDIVGSQTLI